MTEVTIVVPYVPYHADHLQTALASVAAQTVAADVIVVRDDAMRGAGVARNLGLAAVTTPLVVFLDADDWLAPTFLERCLISYDGRRYIFTDHYQDERLVEAPNCPWVNRTWHVITTLLPTEWVRAVGGFDETLPGGEDTDLYLKLTASGYCGKRLAEPLFYYGKDGQRAHAFVHGPDYDRVMQQWTAQYGGKTMSCCGENESLPDGASGERQSGDILAQAVWQGNRVVRGVMTGRAYPRTGNGKTEWVDPADVKASPHLWRRIETQAVPQVSPSGNAGMRVQTLTTTPTASKPALNGVAEIGQALFSPRPAPPMPVDPVAVQPNVAKATALYRQATEPAFSLSDAEVAALKAGHAVEIRGDEVRINRTLAPDIVTQPAPPKPRKPRTTPAKRKPATPRKAAR